MSEQMSEIERMIEESIARFERATRGANHEPEHDYILVDRDQMLALKLQNEPDGPTLRMTALRADMKDVTFFSSKQAATCALVWNADHPTDPVAVMHWYIAVQRRIKLLKAMLRELRAVPAEA